MVTINEDKKDNFIYYQNTRGLHNQKDELSTMTLKRNLGPHLRPIHLSEHHMKGNETII